MSFVTVDITIDSYEFAYLDAIGHKHEDNMIIETHCNNVLNEMIDPNDNKIFRSTELKEFVGIVLHPCSFIANQPGKRSYINHTGSNSECGVTFECSCNAKELCLKLASCEKCSNLLILVEDLDQCDDCLN